MKKVLFSLTVCFTLAISTSAQKFNKSLNKDSLFRVILKDLPEEMKTDLIKAYHEGDEDTKEFLLFMLSMPRSSKKEMIANIDSNFDNINYLKTEYAKMVPEDYYVNIEFNPANQIIMTKESIDLKISHTVNNQISSDQEWNLEYDSPKLAKMIQPLNWTNATLEKIKKMLADAKCISIDNGNVATIGFARSGMGKYSVKLFNNDLTNEEIKNYNDGCTYIFYKKNIVLLYGGGAVGSQCFPD